MAKIKLTLPITIGGGDGNTNLSYISFPTQGEVTSDTGTSAIIPLADITNAGLLSPLEKLNIFTSLQPGDNISQLNNDSGYITNLELAEVATSGDYSDLINKPNLSIYAIKGNVVHLTGNEEINGIKTFNDGLSGVLTGHVEGWSTKVITPSNNSNIDFPIVFSESVSGEPVSLYGIDNIAGVKINPFLKRITAEIFRTPTGTSDEFLKADGSKDANVYALASAIPINFIPLTGTTISNPVTGDIEFSNGVYLYNENLIEDKKASVQFIDGNITLTTTNISTNEYISLNLESTNVEISSTNPLSRGLISFNDFSSTITDLDYTQKIYVDTEISNVISTIDLSAYLLSSVAATTYESLTNKSNSYTLSSTTTYPNTKALVDGLATKQNNITNPITGTPTIGYVTKSSGNGEITDSLIYDTGIRVGIGTTSPNRKLTVEHTAGCYIGLNNINENNYTIGSDANGFVFYDDTHGRYMAQFDKTTGAFSVDGNISATSFNGSAILTGTPTAPTAIVGTNTTQIATTAFVKENTDATAQWTKTGDNIRNGNIGTVDIGNSYSAGFSAKTTINGDGYNSAISTKGKINSNIGYGLSDQSSGMFQSSGIVFTSYLGTIKFNPIYTSQTSAGTYNFVGFENQTIAPTSGGRINNMFNLSPIINQTGGANGITRGIYINPTLTSAFDFRAIEVVTGKVIIPAGTSSNEAVNKGQLDSATSDFLLYSMSF